jgi:hypothetical protein
MREYYSEQKRQLDIRSQLLLTTKKVLSNNENNFIQVEEPKVYDALTFVIPEGYVLPH